MFEKIDKRFASILCMNTIFIQSALLYETWVSIKHEFYLLNDVFYIKQQNVNLFFKIMLYPGFK
jgi:hypothetical protein